ncbi:AfsA-related hotdog domain-containing protein [Micromonospora sp. BQ11]|uniref:AfsA-related hotdog domain-containing protein n=1 Tax=Micromonospora sp. BQ11 TaxID=3452212 RepID=UPI003F8CD28E
MSTRAVDLAAEPQIGSTIPLVVDQGHPFFFDHPLDHVPGIQLAVGLLDLFREVVGAPDGDRPHDRLRLSLTFSRLCELDAETYLHVMPAAGRFHLRAEQHGHAVCEGHAELVEESVPVRVVAAPAEPAPSAPAELVHRHRPQNIGISEVRRPCPEVAESQVLSPPPGHFLRRHDPARYSSEELLEAGRQFCVMLSHLDHGRSLDTQILWMSVDLDVPCGLPSTLPLLLRWPAMTPAVGARARFELALTVAGDPTPLGHLTYVSHALSREAYLRKRRTAGNQDNDARRGSQ